MSELICLGGCCKQHFSLLPVPQTCIHDNRLNSTGLDSTRFDLTVVFLADDVANPQVILAEANQVLQKKFDFCSITIQVENYSDDMTECKECQEPRD